MSPRPLVGAVRQCECVDASADASTVLGSCRHVCPRSPRWRPAVEMLKAAARPTSDHRLSKGSRSPIAASGSEAPVGPGVGEVASSDRGSCRGDRDGTATPSGDGQVTAPHASTAFWCVPGCWRPPSSARWRPTRSPPVMARSATHREPRGVRHFAGGRRDLRDARPRSRQRALWATRSAARRPTLRMICGCRWGP